MKLPKFLLADHSDFQQSIFVIHTEFPRFIINLVDDEIEWWENIDTNDQQELELQIANLIEQATAFYDHEIEKYKED